MVDLGAVADRRSLDLHEIANVRVGLEFCAGAQAREGADGRAAVDPRALEMREGADRHIVGDLDARSEDDVRLDRHVAAELRVRAEMNRVRRDQCRARAHRGFPEPALRHGFDGGELDAVVDALHLVLGGGAMHGLETALAGAGDDVGQVIFLLGVLIADRVEQFERTRAVERHQAGVAERRGALGLAGVLVLADRHELAAGAGEEPAVAVRIGGLEAQGRHRRAIRDGGAQAREGLGPDQRRIGEGDQDIVVAALDRRTCGEHGVSGAEAIGLHEHFGRWRELTCNSGHIVPPRPDDQRDGVGAGGLNGGDDMRDHGAACDLMQHLRPRRTHPRALACGQNDSDAAAGTRHFNLREGRADGGRRCQKL